MEIPFMVVVEPDFEDGGYIATTPSLAGVAGQGETKREAIADLEEALDFTLQDMINGGEPLPEEDAFSQTSKLPDDESIFEIRVAV